MINDNPSCCDDFIGTISTDSDEDIKKKIKEIFPQYYKHLIASTATYSLLYGPYDLKWRRKKLQDSFIKASKTLEEYKKRIQKTNFVGEKMNKTETHAAICNELTDLYERKNADYGDSFAELRKEFPNSVCLRLTDKLNRLKKLYDPKTIQKVSDESINDTLKDIANYAILELIERGYEPDPIESVLTATSNAIKDSSKRNTISCSLRNDSDFGVTLLMDYVNDNGTLCNSICLPGLALSYPRHTMRSIFDLGKHIYDFLEEAFEDEFGEGYLSQDTLLKNSVFIASDLMDSNNGETLVYNVEDPDEIELM